MKNKAILALSLLSLSLVACEVSETAKAQNEVYYGDKPARIICQGYGGVMVNTTTTGRIEFDSTGRIDFVDAQTGRLTKTEGECVVTYAR